MTVVEVGSMSTPNQESIKSMHRALFANIDEDDGMSQTIATLQGLRGTIHTSEKSNVCLKCAAMQHAPFVYCF